MKNRHDTLTTYIILLISIGFLVLTLSGLFLYSFIDPSNPPIWLIGVPAAAVSLIFKAFYGFGLKLDKVGIGLAMFSCAIAIMINGDEHIAKSSSQFVYPFLLTFGGLFTFIDFSRGPKSIGDYVRSTVVHAQTVSAPYCAFSRVNPNEMLLLVLNHSI